jgi:hypothetical protein
MKKSLLFIGILSFLFACSQPSSTSQEHPPMNGLLSSKVVIHPPTEGFSWMADSTGYDNPVLNAHLYYNGIPVDYSTALEDFQSIVSDSLREILEKVTFPMNDQREGFLIKSREFASESSEIENFISLVLIFEATDGTHMISCMYPDNQEANLEPLVRKSMKEIKVLP